MFQRVYAPVGRASLFGCKKRKSYFRLTHHHFVLCQQGEHMVLLLCCDLIQNFYACHEISLFIIKFVLTITNLSQKSMDSPLMGNSFKISWENK